MTADLTKGFHAALYILTVEAFLFFAVITQTKSTEPGAHGGVARTFCLIFLFQSIASLFLVIASQLSDGIVGMYCAIISAGAIALIVLTSIPAAAYIAFPEARGRSWKTVAIIFNLGIILTASFIWSSSFHALPDIPYTSKTFRVQLLGGIVGALCCIAIACVIRMIRSYRGVRGMNGAFVLLLGVALIFSGGYVWFQLTPLCSPSSETVWPKTCPLPRACDHNVLLAVIIMIGNIISTEGILRLMSAGNGAEGYVEILS